MLDYGLLSPLPFLFTYGRMQIVRTDCVITVSKCVDAHNINSTSCFARLRVCFVVASPSRLLEIKTPQAGPATDDRPAPQHSIHTFRRLWIKLHLNRENGCCELLHWVSTLLAPFCVWFFAPFLNRTDLMYQNPILRERQMVAERKMLSLLLLFI